MLYFMQKTLKYLLFIIPFFFCITTTQAQDISHRSSKWILLKEKKGVQFYIRHKPSRFDRKINTLLRLRNTNRQEVTVSFIPIFTCVSMEEGEVIAKQKSVKVKIYPRHSITLLAYRPCKGDIPVEILIDKIRIY